MQESKSCALPLGDSPTMIVATATGWIQGFEPWASRATIWRANQLRYTHHRDVIVSRLARQIVALEAQGSNPCIHPVAVATIIVGLSPSGKAQDFDSCIRWFESN